MAQFKSIRFKQVSGDANPIEYGGIFQDVVNGSYHVWQPFDDGKDTGLSYWGRFDTSDFDWVEDWGTDGKPETVLGMIEYVLGYYGAIELDQYPVSRTFKQAREFYLRSKKTLTQYPTQKELAKELTRLKQYIESEEGLEITLGAGPNGYALQTGDNSFTGPAYHYRHWGVTTLYTDSNARELAKDLIDQVIELALSN